MRYGSLNNLLWSQTPSKDPAVGDGATIVMWSDRKPATIIEVQRFKTGARAGQVKAVIVQVDEAIRTDSNGMSDAQSYTFKRDPNGAIRKYTLRADGTYRSDFGSLYVGERGAYYDYSF